MRDVVAECCRGHLVDLRRGQIGQIVVLSEDVGKCASGGIAGRFGILRPVDWHDRIDQGVRDLGRRQARQSLWIDP